MMDNVKIKVNVVIPDETIEKINNIIQDEMEIEITGLTTDYLEGLRESKGE